jgi:predicted Zn-dependent protease
LNTSVGFGERDGGEDEDEEENNAIKRLEHAYTEKLATASLTAHQHKEYLSWCQSVVRQRTDAIVGNQHRGSYDKAAELTAACAETLRLQGKADEADAFLDDARNRFPRHRAFQSELDAATMQMGRSSKRKR